MQRNNSNNKTNNVDKYGIKLNTEMSAASVVVVAAVMLISATRREPQSHR